MSIEEPCAFWLPIPVRYAEKIGLRIPAGTARAGIPAGATEPNLNLKNKRKHIWRDLGDVFAATLRRSWAIASR